MDNWSNKEKEQYLCSDNSKLYYDRIRNFYKDAKTLDEEWFVDLSNLLSDDGVFFDECHCTPKGNGIIADYFYDFINKVVDV